MGIFVVVQVAGVDDTERLVGWCETQDEAERFIEKCRTEFDSLRLVRDPSSDSGVTLLSDPAFEGNGRDRADRPGGDPYGPYYDWRAVDRLPSDG